MLKVSNEISKSCTYQCRKAGLRQIIYYFDEMLTLARL